MSDTFDFSERREFSDIGVTDVTRLLISRFHGVTTTTLTTLAEDKRGIDLRVPTESGRDILVDVKTREIDPVQMGWPDDVALETWSVVPDERRPDGAPGWSRDFTKQTDYVFFYWQPTRRGWMVPFVPLRQAFHENWRRWYEALDESLEPLWRRETQKNDGWCSECLFVPRRDLAAAMGRVCRWDGGR
jgi:hypothetical protein